MDRTRTIRPTASIDLALAYQYMSDLLLVFFFHDTATTEIYTLSLHDALPISGGLRLRRDPRGRPRLEEMGVEDLRSDRRDRKSTRLNSSHSSISYAVFCLKKKKHPAHRLSALPPPTPYDTQYYPFLDPTEGRI